jgi:hypothetical protein
MVGVVEDLMPRLPGTVDFPEGLAEIINQELYINAAVDLR